MDVEDREPIMEQFVIYEGASDLPQFKYVCRKWTIYRGGDPVPDPQLAGAANDGTGLDLMRVGLQARGLHRLDRFDNDDPAILEVWI